MHQETVRIVDTQINDMGKQMAALDDFVAKARSQNGRFHEANLSSLDTIAANVRESHSSFCGQLTGFSERVGQLQEDVAVRTDRLQQSTSPLDNEVRQPLSELRDSIQNRPLKEYKPTGVTPQKRRYEYPTTLPRTESHDCLRSGHRTSQQLTALPFSGELSPLASPSKTFIYNDAAEEVGTHLPSTTSTSSNTGLREVDINVARPVACDGDDANPTQNPPLDLDEIPEKDEPEQPPRKRRRSASSNRAASSNNVERKLPQKMLSRKMAGMMEGRENVPPSGIAGGRRLRNRTSG